MSESNEQGQEQERFYAEGNDVYDRKRPDIVCGFIDNDFTRNMADEFNAGTENPAGYTWWTRGDDNSPTIKWEA